MALFVSTVPRNPVGHLVPEEMRRFVLWLFDRLEIPCKLESEGLYRISLPSSHWEEFENRSEVLFTFDAERYDATATNDLEFAAPGHRLFRWLFEQALASDVLERVRPPRQPEHVSEITSRLFSAYTLDGGSVHLAGCSLEDKWLVRFSLDPGSEESDPAETLITPEGTEMPNSLQQELGVHEITSHAPSANDAASQGVIPPQQIARIAAQIQRGISQLLCGPQPGTPADHEGAEDEAQDRSPSDGAMTIEQVFQRLSRIQLIRTRWVSGKLRFSFDGQTVDAPFSGWARCLSAPEIECPRTGRLTSHLSITDDHRLAAFESIESCEKTGRRVLTGELVECSLSGKRFLPEFVGHCAVTNQSVLSESLLECPSCRQPVSPVALSGARCQGCRQIAKVTNADARLSLILTEYPKLEAWRRWRLAETESNFLVIAKRGWQRLLIVVEKETVQVKFVAKGGLRPGWTAVESVEEQAEILGAWT